MPFLNMVQAINQTLKEEMRRDERVIVLGEDVGVNGGVFRVTEGLLEEFGPERVLDTPLDESGIVGFAIGLALYGMKPVAEIQFAGFIPDAFEQITTSLAKMRWMTGGQFGAPLVIRVPSGGGIRGGPWHSQSIEAYFAHTAGLVIVAPTGPYEAKGLLLSAIRGKDPVLFLEYKRLYRAFREEVPEEAYTLPLGKAHIMREGKDISVIAYGAMAREALSAAEALHEEGIDVEVVNLRTLVPLDAETLLESVAKTRRAVVVYEASKTCGFGAEVAALLAERAFDLLEAPVFRVAGLDAPIHFSIGDEYLPDAARIAHTIRRAVEHAPVATEAVSVPPRTPGPEQATESPVPLGIDKDGPMEAIPFRGLRRRIAEKMVRAKRTIPHVTHIEQADFTELLKLREEYRERAEAHGVKLTVLPFLVKAVVAALKEHPIFNATLDEAGGQILLKKFYHIGIATATEEGLIVPVVKDADRKSLLEIAAEIQSLAQRAREKRISVEELQGGTFTITNVGSIGGAASTPIIHHPEVAILAVHKVRPQPVARDGGVVVHPVAQLSLTFDHRVADGAQGAAFMNDLVALIENPRRLLTAL